MKRPASAKEEEPKEEKAEEEPKDEKETEDKEEKDRPEGKDAKPPKAKAKSKAKGAAKSKGKGKVKGKAKGKPKAKPKPPAARKKKALTRLGAFFFTSTIAQKLSQSGGSTLIRIRAATWRSVGSLCRAKHAIPLQTIERTSTRSGTALGVEGLVE